jgi:hypothetical protein
MLGRTTGSASLAELLEGIERLIDNPAMRQEMSICARSYAEKQSWDKTYLNFWNV